MVATIRVNDRGTTRIMIRKLRSLTPELSDAQREAGRRIGDSLRREARDIIRQKAPRSSGNLANSLYVTQSARHKGWYTKVTTDTPYAKVVERGGPSEIVRVTPDLLEWASRIGPRVYEAYKGRNTVTVRKGNNPNYDTRIGMKFFQIPFERKRNSIDDEYNESIRQTLRSLKMV